MENFSDGVMAIAITLLAVELKVPHLVAQSLSGSISEVVPYIPSLLTFILSFGTIAIFWVNHHQLTQHMHAIRRRTTWANMLFLFFQALIPFASIVLTANISNPLALLGYSLTLFGGSVSFVILRFTIHPKGSLSGSSIRRSFMGPLVYLLAAIISPISVWATYALLVIPPIYYFLPKPSHDRDED